VGGRAVIGVSNTAGAMSQENVEVVRQHMEAWQRDDFDSWLATMDPTVEWHAAVERLVEGTESVYRGHEGMPGLWRSWRSEVEDFEIEAQELRDVGDERVVLLGRIRWRGLASGIATESPIGMVITVRGAKIIRSMDYLSHEEALEAAGLSEQDAHADS
jgi:ketosteroid isomerase-like protein